MLSLQKDVYMVNALFLHLCFRHDIQQAIQTWRLAMELRYKDPDDIKHKPDAQPNPAYNNQQEAKSMKVLSEKFPIT